MTGCYQMQNMYDVVHIDEKWFDLYKGSARYYLAPEDGFPYRSTPNKRYLGKIMSLAAIARHRYNGCTKNEFDGEIGRKIQVQQDNAAPHIDPFDVDVAVAGEQGGWNIGLCPNDRARLTSIRLTSEYSTPCKLFNLRR
ncbi:unnamed protein product [Phytophthora fragariaefolia]|uniref:Unnamed protein product n=1 Tax=Phytophthora fragariaefolia TaxID=1490495 RepID=A0A9W6TS39_9STRA|nr:unnamed protein product [Phytophthora fragariaefolia]